MTWKIWGTPWLGKPSLVGGLEHGFYFPSYMGWDVIPTPLTKSIIFQDGYSLHHQPDHSFSSSPSHGMLSGWHRPFAPGRFTDWSGVEGDSPGMIKIAGDGWQEHMYIYIYIYTYIHACMHAYMHTCIQAYMHTCIHAYMHTCIHAYMHTYIHTYIHT